MGFTGKEYWRGLPFPFQIYTYSKYIGFPGSSDGKESACNVGDPNSITVSGRSSGGSHGNPLQYSFPENPMDRGAWKATIHEVTRVRHDLATKEKERDIYTWASVLTKVLVIPTEK